MWVRGRARVALLSSVVSLSTVAVVQGADAVVGTGTSGSCTEAALNTAVAAVNVSPGGTITFACGGPKTINLTSQKVFNNPSATYAVDGGGLITLSGQNATRIVLHLSGTLTLRNLTLSNGRASGVADNASGGAVRSDNGGVVLVLSNVAFLGNVSNLTGVSPGFSAFDYGGGAVYTRLGQLTATNCDFSNNTATNSSGGAIHGRSSTIAISGSTFTANASNGGGFGGAIYVDGLSPAGANGTLQLAHSTFEDNTAYNIGGAFYFFLHVGQNEGVTIDTAAFVDNHVLDNSGTIPWLPTRSIGGGGVVDGGDLTVLNSTFAGNSAQSSLGGSPGGGLYVDKNDSVQITNSTFSGNRAEGTDNAASGGGLVIYGNTQPFQITNSTISYNHAGYTGGGIQSSTSGTLTNTIVAQNTAGNPWSIQLQCAAELTSGGPVMQFPDVVGAPSAGNPRCTASALIANPLLSALADNGGFAPTHALAAGSPAVDAGTCVVGTDQRGASRPQGAGCDIGSFEMLTGPDFIFGDGFE
jgi:predicted outer membrane repeat protein